MSDLLSAANMVGNVGTVDNVDMTISFMSDMKLNYNDAKKAYDLEIWHGNINPYTHDAELCVKKLHELSLKDSSLLVKWAKEGLVTLTADGKIDTVRFSVRGIDATFMVKTDGKYILDKEASEAWRNFLNDNYKAVCNLLITEVCTEYDEWIKDHAEIYHVKEEGEKVLFALHLEPLMLRIHFNILHEYESDDAMRIFKHNYEYMGFYIYAGENVAHCWVNPSGVDDPEEFTVPIPDELAAALRIAIN